MPMSDSLLYDSRPAIETASDEELAEIRAMGLDPATITRFREIPRESPISEPPEGSIAAMGDEEQLRLAEEAGIDPATIGPFTEYSPVGNLNLPPKIAARGFTSEQTQYAITQESDPAKRLDMFASVNDLRGAIEDLRRMGFPDRAETERIHKETGIPLEVVEKIRKHAPQDLDAYQVAASIYTIAGPDSYCYRTLMDDPEFATDFVNHAIPLAELNAALDSIHASTPRIMLNQFTGSVASMGSSILTGIPAAASQAAREVREMDSPLQSELAIPEGLLEENPAEWIFAQGLNNTIRQQNDELSRWRDDPEYIAIAEANRDRLDALDSAIQRTYAVSSALTYQPAARTGNPLVDTVARPVVQGLGSYLPSMGLGILARGGSLPAILFGLSEGSDVYRENSAEGVDPVTNIFTSLGHSAISALAERYTIEEGLKAPGLRSLLRGATGNSNTFRSRALGVMGGAGRAGLAEAFTEGIQTSSALMATPLAKSLSFGDPIANMFDALVDGSYDILESMWGGFGAGAIGGGAIGKSGMELANTFKYHRFQRNLNTVAKAAEPVMAAKKDLPATRTHVRNMLYDSFAQGKTGLTPTSYASFEDIQHKVERMPAAEAETFLQEIGTTRTAYEQAVENQVDIEVPTENILALPREDAGEVRAMFRSHPSMETASYLRRQFEAVEDMFELGSKLRESIEEDIERGRTPDAISVFYKDLRAIKGKSATEAKAETALLWAWAQTQARRRGLPVDQFANDANVRVALNAMIMNNPAWLAGVLTRMDAESRQEMEHAQPAETFGDAPDVAGERVDPAVAERPASLPERPSGDSLAGEPAGGDGRGASAPPVDSGRGGDGGPDGGIPAPQPQRGLFGAADIPAGKPVDSLTGLPFSLETTTTAGVRAAPELFQFKRASDPATGVKKGQELPGDVDPAALGTMVFYEDVDGQRFVVSGHHRLDLLRRKGGDEEIRAVILREREGWSTDQARAYGAALNIREGGGDIDDYSTFFRETRLDKAEAETQGLLRRENAKTGYAIGAQGNDNVFYGYLNGELSAKRAAAIAEAAPGDGALQDMMIQRKIKTEELPVFAGYVRKLQNSGNLNLGGVQLSLFSSASDMALLAAMEKESAAATREADKLDKQAAALEAMLRAGKTLSPAELNRHGVRAGNKAGMKERAAELRMEAERWRNFFQHPDLLVDVQDRAGTAPEPLSYSQSEKNEDSFLSKFMDRVGKRILVPGLVNPPADKIKALLKPLFDYATKSKKQALQGVTYTNSRQHGFTRELLEAKINRDHFTPGEVEKLLSRDYGSYLHVIDNYGIQHAWKNHGDPKKEGARGQTAVTAEALQLIPELTIPENLDSIEKNRGGQPVFIYKSLVGGRIVVIEEVRQKRNYLTFHDMYGNWDGLALHDVSMHDNIIAPPLTSETFRVSPSHPTQSVLDADGNVKHDGNGNNEPAVASTDLDPLVGIKSNAEALPHPPPAGSEYSIDQLSQDINGDISHLESQGEGSIEPGEIHHQGPRARVDLFRATPEHRQAAVIRLLRNADASSVPHELAHIFLDDMAAFVHSGEADNLTRKQFAALLGWVGGPVTMDPSLAKGTPEYDQARAAATGNIEKAARAFEQYLAEGRAPSMDLVGSFDLFGKWLPRVYKNIREYVAGELNGDIRGVYDSWLASDEQIREAELYYSGRRGNVFANLLDDDDERKKLAEQMEDNRARVKARYAGDMASAWIDAYATEDTVRTNVTREVSADGTYRAIAMAREKKMSRDGAMALVGKQTVLDIVSRHGDLFARQNRDGFDVNTLLRGADYFEKDGLRRFLEEYADADTIAEAVRRHGSRGRKRRYFEAAESVKKAGGMDIAAAIAAVGDETVNRIIERHGQDLFATAADSIESMAADHGFRSGEEMLTAMAKAENEADRMESLFEERMRQKVREARQWANEQVETAGDAGWHNPSEDYEAENIDLARQAAWRGLKGRERRRQEYIERRVLTDRARETLNGMSLRRAANYANWASAERYHAKNAAEAAARGDSEVALDALNKQQYFHAMVTEAFRLRQERQKFVNRYSYRMARSDLSTVEYQFRESIKDILSHYNIITSRAFQPEFSDPSRLTLPQETDGLVIGEGNKARTVDEDIDIFLPPLETIIPGWILQKRRPDNYKGLNDLTAEQMRDLDSTIQLLMNRGRGELNALHTERAATLEKQKDIILQTLKDLPDHKVRDSRKLLNRVIGGAESYLVSNLQIDRIADEIDGNPTLQGKEMGLMATLVDMVRGKEVEQRQMLEKFQVESRGDFAVFDAFAKRLKREFGSKFFPIDGVTMPDLIQDRKAVSTWDADMLLSIFLNMGNSGNLHALQKGLGLTQAQITTLQGLATAEEWQAVANVASRLDALYPFLDAVYFRMTNRHMPKVEATPFTVETWDGQVLSLPGWYYPLVYDPALSDRTAQQVEQADWIGFMNAIHSPSKPADGFTKSRVVDENGNPIVERPPLLKTSVLISHLQNATRWGTHAEALYEFRRLTMDDDIKTAMVRKIGSEKYRYLREWTNRMARPDKGANAGVNKIFSSLRSASTVAALGWNVKSALRQNESLGIAADTMSKASRDKSSGWYWVVQGMKKVGASGYTGGWVGYESPALREMYALSAEARMRAKDVSKEFRDMAGATDPAKGGGVRVGKRKLSRDIFFHFTLAMDKGVSSAVWWGAYLQGMEGHAWFDTDGLTDQQLQEKAVRYANRVLRTQQSPFAADYTRVQADSGPISLFTQFLGGVTPYLSHTYGVSQMWRRGQVSNTGLLSHLISVYTMPVLVTAMIKRAVFGWGDDDDESFASEMAWGMLNGLASPLPVVRDVVSVAQYGERSATIPSISTPARAGIRAYKGLVNLSEGDAEAAAADFGRALTVFAPIMTPFRQARQMGEAMGIVDDD